MTLGAPCSDRESLEGNEVLYGAPVDSLKSKHCRRCTEPNTRDHCRQHLKQNGDQPWAKPLAPTWRLSGERSSDSFGATSSRSSGPTQQSRCKRPQVRDKILSTPRDQQGGGSSFLWGWAIERYPHYHFCWQCQEMNISWSQSPERRHTYRVGMEGQSKSGCRHAHDLPSSSTSFRAAK